MNDIVNIFNRYVFFIPNLRNLKITVIFDPTLYVHLYLKHLLNRFLLLNISMIYRIRQGFDRELNYLAQKVHAMFEQALDCILALPRTLLEGNTFTLTMISLLIFLL